MAKFISGNWIMGLFVSYVWIGGVGVIAVGRLEVAFDDWSRFGQESL